mgnify:CR=1 FL=1
MYFRMCSVMVTPGIWPITDDPVQPRVDPQTGEQLVDSTIVRIVTTLMMLCGMYDESGEYAVKVGMPSKAAWAAASAPLPATVSASAPSAPC